MSFYARAGRGGVSLRKISSGSGWSERRLGRLLERAASHRGSKANKIEHCYALAQAVQFLAVMRNLAVDPLD